MKDLVLRLYRDAAVFTGFLGVAASTTLSVWDDPPLWVRVAAPVAVAVAAWWKTTGNGTRR